MGKLLVQEPGGHVAIDWDDDSINIDLNPVDGKAATRRERDHVLTLIKKCIVQGFKVEIDGTPVTQADAIPKQAKKIIVQLEKPDIQKLVGNLVGSEQLSKHILFRLDDNGKGELIQKSEFKTDSATYATTAPMSGG